MSPGMPRPRLATAGNDQFGDHMEIIPKFVVRAAVDTLVYPFLDNEWPMQNLRDFICLAFRRPV
jgi:hypothetical protein